MLQALSKLLSALSSNRAPGEIAHAFACGMLLGFMPKTNLLWYILFVLIFFLRIQRATLTLTLLVAALLTPLLDPYFDSVGYWVLTQESLIPTYIKLLNIPFVAFTKFNNTVVMGSLICSLCAYIPFYAIARLLVFLWRKYLADGIRKSKLANIMRQIPLIQKLISMAQGN